LPLENLSGDPAQDYFADGMTEALISNLTQIRLVVGARGFERPTSICPQTMKTAGPMIHGILPLSFNYW